MSERRIDTFVPARSRRVCPGLCAAPAVMTTTSAPWTHVMSSPPMIRAPEASGEPWARSRTSASTFSFLRSYSAIVRALPRSSAA